MNTHLDKLEYDEIATLYAAGKTPHSIGKLLGRDPKTISKALKNPDVMDLVDERRLALGEQFSHLAHRALQSITDIDLEKMNAYQKTLISSISYDKHRLATGQSTQNFAVIFARATRDTEINPETMNGTLVGDDI
jgi:hypothetical protein